MENNGIYAVYEDKCTSSKISCCYLTEIKIVYIYEWHRRIPPQIDLRYIET